MNGCLLFEGTFAFVGVSVVGPRNQQHTAFLPPSSSFTTTNLSKQNTDIGVSVIIFHKHHLPAILTLEYGVTTSFAMSETTQHHSIISQKTRLLSGFVIHHYTGKAEPPVVGCTCHTSFGKSRGNKFQIMTAAPNISSHTVYLCCADVM